jgi:hypothetical protein
MEYEVIKDTVLEIMDADMWAEEARDSAPQVKGKEDAATHIAKYIQSLLKTK